MVVIKRRLFLLAYKRLHKSQRLQVDKAIKEIIGNPMAGESKKHFLNGIRVYKFRIDNQLTLLAYSYFEETITIELIKLDSHQNFYEDLEKELKRSD